MGIHAHTPLLIADTKIAPAAVAAEAILVRYVDSAFCSFGWRLSEMNLTKYQLVVYYSKIVTIGRQRRAVGVSPSRSVSTVVALPDCTLIVLIYPFFGTVHVA